MDDGLTVEKANFENAEEITDPQGLKIKRKRAVPSENAFFITKPAAEAKGMQVNTLKTSIMCVSDASTFQARAYIRDGMNEMESSGPPAVMKVLGFTFGPTSSVKYHVATVRRKFRQRLWTLYNLRANGFSKEELVRVYKTSIRPVADYLDVVYHSLLTDEMDEELDRLQNWALQIIFGPKLVGRRLRTLAGVTTLRQRRVEHCDKFASKCAKLPRFEHWFPKKQSSILKPLPAVKGCVNCPFFSS